MKYYTSDKVIEEFYKSLADGDSNSLRRIHIPRSEVFYVREKYYQDTGNRISLEEMEEAMFLEGMLEEKDVYDGLVQKILDAKEAEGNRS